MKKEPVGSMMSTYSAQTDRLVLITMTVLGLRVGKVEKRPMHVEAL